MNRDRPGRTVGATGCRRIWAVPLVLGLIALVVFVLVLGPGLGSFAGDPRWIAPQSRRIRKLKPQDVVELQ
jgi:hypothetical protein